MVLEVSCLSGYHRQARLHDEGVFPFPRHHAPSFCLHSFLRRVFLAIYCKCWQCMFPVFYPWESKQSWKQGKNAILGNPMKCFDQNPWQTHTMKRKKTSLKITKEGEKILKWWHRTSSWWQPAVDTCGVSQPHVWTVLQGHQGSLWRWWGNHHSVSLFKLAFDELQLSTKPSACHGWCQRWMPFLLRERKLWQMLNIMICSLWSDLS